MQLQLQFTVTVTFGGGDRISYYEAFNTRAKECRPKPEPEAHTNTTAEAKHCQLFSENHRCINGRGREIGTSPHFR